MNSIALDPTKPRRWRIDDHGSQFIITIPRKISWMSLILELLIAAYIGYELPRIKEQTTQSWFVLGIFVLVGLGKLKDFLWNLGGQEVITFTSDGLTLRREVFGIGWSRIFDLKKVGGLSFEKAGNDSKSGIVFDYDSALITRSRRFGDDLIESEANELIARIIERFPEIDRSAPESKHFITLDLSS